MTGEPGCRALVAGASPGTAAPMRQVDGGARRSPRHLADPAAVGGRASPSCELPEPGGTGASVTRKHRPARPVQTRPPTWVPVLAARSLGRLGVTSTDPASLTRTPSLRLANSLPLTWVPISCRGVSLGRPSTSQPCSDGRPPSSVADRSPHVACRPLRSQTRSPPRACRSSSNADPLAPRGCRLLPGRAYRWAGLGLTLHRSALLTWEAFAHVGAGSCRAYRWAGLPRIQPCSRGRPRCPVPDPLAPTWVPVLAGRIGGPAFHGSSLAHVGGRAVRSQTRLLPRACRFLPRVSLGRSSADPC
jgi:hypothetical protein